MEIFQSHKNQKAASYWIPFGTGWLTASGAPSPRKLEEWSEKGVTDIVTLQREDEMRSELPTLCQELNMSWHHIPLSGRRLERKTDKTSLEKLPNLLHLFGPDQNNRKVVFHCAAGMHRTGISLYVLLRLGGHNAETAVTFIHQARELTAEELTKTFKKTGKLIDKAEFILQTLSND